MKKYLLLFVLLLLCSCPKRVKDGVSVTIINKRIYYGLNKSNKVNGIRIYEYKYNKNEEKYENANSYDFEAKADILNDKTVYKDIVWDKYNLPYKTGYIYNVILQCASSSDYESYYKIIDKENPEIVRIIDLDNDNDLKIEYVKKPKF
ncbi:MAG TPA: hypothetical protein PLV17_07565 [Spirochaetota bacterium]|nr:hypothetical protein [Spirochaetota bacterium]